MASHKAKYNRKAQAITEMAVFGIVLIFMIGAIVRQGLSASMAQNQNLRAMRVALKLSLQTSLAGNAKRNSATVLFVEDRLSPEFNKYGALSRVPSFAQGSGTMTNLLFMPVDKLEYDNLPVTDVIINGKHFEFTSANFVEHEITETEIITRKPRTSVFLGWDPATRKPMYDVTLGEEIRRRPFPANEWHLTEDVPLFYTSNPNSPRRSFCLDDSTCDPLTVDQAFDLNRNGVYGDDPRTEEDRLKMAWQWQAILGKAENIEINTNDGQYSSWDVDGDGSDEVIYEILSSDPDTGAVTELLVMDYNEGDINGAFEKTGEIAPGIQQDTSIYTYTQEGTYYEIKEGDLYIPGTNQYVRSARQKDQIDVITRLFQLSNNTGRICQRADGGWVPNVTTESNPVEVCNNCTAPHNISKICFDTNVNMLFIRSRLLDRAGSKWITDITNDLAE